MKTGLVDLLSTLPIRSPAQQLGAWATQKNTHNRVTQILSALGKRVTNAQAKRLNELGLSFEVLQGSQVLFQRQRGVQQGPSG